MKDVLIEARGLCRRFGEQAIINDMDLDIYKNDFTVIMGSSGAGKSTLLYMLASMDQPDEGSLKMDGQDLSRLNADQAALFRRKHCGFVFQQMYMLEGMSLMDNVLSAGLLSNPDKKSVLKRAKELFERVNIPEVTWKKTAAQVSGGECQRAGIVRAAVSNPDVIFADEPTGALNSENSTAVLEILKDMNENGQSIIMVTHDRKSALYANRIIYLKDGKIQGELSLNEIGRAREEKLDAFLKEMAW